MTLSRVQRDLEPDLPLRITLRDPLKCPVVFARDLTEITVRALFANAFLVETDECTGRSRVDPLNAIFHRVLTKREMDLLGTTVIASPPAAVQFEPIAQPASLQRISIVITGFSSGGDITLTGTDDEGDAVTEDFTVTADGTFFTTAAFASLDPIDTDAGTAGIEVDTGDFTFRLFVHDGLVDLEWAAGDLDDAGEFLLVIELLDTSGELETAHPPIELTVEEKILPPIAVITAVVTSPFAVGDTATITGKGFLDATKAQIVELLTQVVTDLDVFVVNSETEIVGDIPAAQLGGTYGVQVVGPGGTSALFESIVVLPIITNFSPTAVDPLDTVTIDGVGFTGATGADIIEQTTGAVVALTGFAVNSDIEVEGDVPAGTPAGEYDVRVTGLSNTSNRLGTLTVQ